MAAHHIKAGLIPNLLLAAILVLAQWGALVHAFEHDASNKPQSQVCTNCVAASQLGFACVDTPVTAEPLPSCIVLNADSAREIKSLHALVARQRGPPSSL